VTFKFLVILVNIGRFSGSSSMSLTCPLLQQSWGVPLSILLPHATLPSRTPLISGSSTTGMALPHIPRDLCVGKVEDPILCELCQGVLREPRFSKSCSNHAFCRTCYQDALRDDAHCPHLNCNIAVEGEKSLVKFRPFEDLVNKTELRCPNSISIVAADEADALQVSATSKLYTVKLWGSRFRDLFWSRNEGGGLSVEG